MLFIDLILLWVYKCIIKIEQIRFNAFKQQQHSYFFLVAGICVYTIAIVSHAIMVIITDK